MSGATYKITLPQFEGPFDLLLFFIERDELDIYDIPIAKITDDFLDYIRQMEALNIDMASEFILVAATLCRIKARLLIPRKEVDEEGNEIDPRDELVARLLEYKRLKSVLEDLRKLEEERSLREKRGNTAKELRKIAEKALVDAELESITLFKLMRAFERVMQRYEDARSVKMVHTVYRYDYTIEDQASYIVEKLRPGHRSDFDEIFGGLENRIHAVVTFLALLELLNNRKVRIIQGLGYNNFWLELPAEGEEEE